jgi:hypothetical protein
MSSLLYGTRNAIGENLKFAVRMQAKAMLGINAVFVDNSKASPRNMLSVPSEK